MATTSIYALTKPTVGGDSGVWGGYLNTDMDTLDDIIARPKVVFNSPTVGATTTCDFSLARVFVFTVSQVTTLAFTNVPSSSFAVYADLVITNGSAFALTFPGSVTWLQGVAPSLQSSGVDVVRMVTKDGGTTWYAIQLGKNLSITGTFKAQIGGSASQAKPAELVSMLSGSTGATGESSIVSYTLPASALAATTDAIRVRIYGSAVTQNAQLRLKFGATYVLNAGGGNNITQPNVYVAEAVIRRTGAATQIAVGQVTQAAAVTSTERTTPAETLSGTVVVDVRGNTAVGGGVLNVDIVTIEHLSS